MTFDRITQGMRDWRARINASFLVDAAERTYWEETAEAPCGLHCNRGGSLRRGAFLRRGANHGGVHRLPGGSGGRSLNYGRRAPDVAMSGD